MRLRVRNSNSQKHHIQLSQSLKRSNVQEFPQNSDVFMLKSRLPEGQVLIRFFSMLLWVTPFACVFSERYLQLLSRGHVFGPHWCNLLLQVPAGQVLQRLSATIDSLHVMPAWIFCQRHGDVWMPGLHAWHIHGRGGANVLHQLPGWDVCERHSIQQGMHFVPSGVVCQHGCCIRLLLLWGWVFLQLQRQHWMPGVPGWHLHFWVSVSFCMHALLRGDLHAPGWDGFVRALPRRAVCLVCGEHVMQRLLPGLLCPQHWNDELPGLCIWKLQRRVWGKLLHEMPCRLALCPASFQQLLRGLRIGEVCINRWERTVRCVLVAVRGGSDVRVSGMHGLYRQEVLALQEEGLRYRHHRQRDVVPLVWNI